MIRHPFPFHPAALMLAATLTACGGGGTSAPAVPPAAPPPTITLATPASTELLAGTATPLELGATASDGSTITWTLAPGSPGSLSGPSGAKVSYLPPSPPPSLPAPA